MSTAVYFFAYKIVGEECVVKDIFIRKKFRAQGLMLEAAKKLEDIAISRGCKYMTGFVQAWDLNKERALSLYMKFGFKILRLEGQTIIIGKKLGDKDDTRGSQEAGVDPIAK